MQIFVVIAFMIIVTLEVPGLIQQKYWREIIVFGFLLFMGFVVSMLLVSGVKLPFVTELIADLMQKVLNFQG